MPLGDNARPGGNANRIYPATDVDDGVASHQPNVHPSGLMSADELSQEGDGKYGFGKSKINIVAKQNMDNAALKTVDHDLESTAKNARQQPFMS